MGADLLFLWVMGGRFEVLDSGGIVLAGLVVMSAALFVSPLIMARFNAAVIFLYALLLNQQGYALDSMDVWLYEAPALILFAAVSMLVSASRVRSRSDQAAFRDVARDIFERLHLNLAVLDDQDRFILVNSKAVKTLEKSEAELSNITFHELIAPHQELAVQSLLKKFRK